MQVRSVRAKALNNVNTHLRTELISIIYQKARDDLFRSELEIPFYERYRADDFLSLYPTQGDVRRLPWATIWRPFRTV